MDRERRRIIAVEAYHRRTGRYPTRIHSLGTGESFDVEPASDGFLDVRSGLRARSEPTRILVPGTGQAIDITFDEGVTFSGYDPACGERFTGRAGGGPSVTIYDGEGVNFFQYAIEE